jgi:hypothetical protein
MILPTKKFGGVFTISELSYRKIEEIVKTPPTNKIYNKKRTN